MNQSATFDPSIPVLTEVFQDQAVKPEVPEGAEAVQLVEPAQVGPASSDGDFEARAVDAWTEPEWARLERRLSERILHQLQDQVDFVLEQRLRDSMAEALQLAMAGLTSEIRASLQQTIENIVVRAVAQELTHLQTLEK